MFIGFCRDLDPEAVPGPGFIFRFQQFGTDPTVLIADLQSVFGVGIKIKKNDTETVLLFDDLPFQQFLFDQDITTVTKTATVHRKTVTTSADGQFRLFPHLKKHPFLLSVCYLLSLLINSILSQVSAFIPMFLIINVKKDPERVICCLFEECGTDHAFFLSS